MINERKAGLLGQPRQGPAKSASQAVQGSKTAARRVLGDITNARSEGIGEGKTSKMGAVAVKQTNVFINADTIPAVRESSTTISALVDATNALHGRMDADTPGAHSTVSMDLGQDVEAADMSIVEPQRMSEIMKDVEEVNVKHWSISDHDIDDIDERDAGDPLACREYVDDQYAYYRQKECRPGYDPRYIEKQPHINTRMRAILVDWLIEVHYKFKCHPEALYLTVSLIDRFLDRKQVPRAKLQLVGVTAFLIACKFEQIWPPEMKELVYVTDGAYSKKQITDMESFMLATLKFKVSMCTSHTFLVRFLKAAHANEKISHLACYVCERTLQETDTLHFLPSVIAAAAVYLARKNCGARPWTRTLVHYTKNTEESLSSCLRVITPWLNHKSQNLMAVRKKYGSERFSMVSNMHLEGL